ncbi:helix-turn-helix domain-containing protein [Erwinia sp. V71]|uniref:helix-turn-helix domain-containing protein n=1 Tax=Erwinia sp. V71 TaxID=3369424 RepID=UPI003F60B267
MANEDWEVSYIVTELKRHGYSLAAISRTAGLASPTLANTLYRPWPKGEWLIANALGVHPSIIWPNRYKNLKQARLPRYPLAAGDAAKNP